MCLRTPPLRFDKSSAKDTTRVAALGFELELDGSFREVLKMVKGMRFLRSFSYEDQEVNK